MTRKPHFLAIVCVATVVASFATTKLSAQLFTIPWHTIDGGGGYAVGGNFELEGSIGQHDATATMSGGVFEVTGGYWVGTSDAGPIAITPDSFVVTRGTYFAGGLAELSASDNADLKISRATADIQSRTEFEVKGFSPFANPSSLEVALEGSVFARTQVNQTIELFDYVETQWEQVDTRPATRFTDSTVKVVVTGDLSRFVEADTMCMNSRIRYESLILRQQFASNTDQFVWTIGQ